jgi:predicted  nucleic acid-binding Zn-ribbon protein
MEYPRTVVLEDPKLRKLLSQKAALITEGRSKSERIEALEKEMEIIDEEIRAYEKNVNTSDLDAEAKIITESFNAIMQQMTDIKQKLHDRMKSAISPEAIALYEEKKKEKEGVEKERNRIALKVQQFTDRIVPFARKLMAPYLENKYEDYDSIQLEDDKIVTKIFSHLDLFEKSFTKRSKK